LRIARGPCSALGLGATAAAPTGFGATGPTTTLSRLGGRFFSRLGAGPSQSTPDFFLTIAGRGSAATWTLADFLGLPRLRRATVLGLPRLGRTATLRFRLRFFLLLVFFFVLPFLVFLVVLFLVALVIFLFVNFFRRRLFVFDHQGRGL
jgi:hypothetical protein